MNFSSPLIPGTLIARYKRFMAQIHLDSGQEITAHCPNTGSMRTLTDPGTRVWVSYSALPTRKYPYTWEMVEQEGRFIGTNTLLPNRLFRHAFEQGQLATAFAPYTTLQSEISIGRSRLDFCLDSPTHPPCYVEIKNVHFSQGGTALFPDSPTSRGTRHLQDLAHIAAGGGKAVLCYIIQRTDCTAFRVAGFIDTPYAKAFEAAVAQGVQMMAYTCCVSPQGLSLDRPIPILEPLYAL